MEPRVIVKQIAQVCRGLSVTHRLLYYAEVSAVSALPHLTRTPTDPTSCPSPTAENRKFRIDAFDHTFLFVSRERASIYVRCLKNFKFLKIYNIKDFQVVKHESKVNEYHVTKPNVQ